jgi:hypothetical protein
MSGAPAGRRKFDIVREGFIGPFKLNGYESLSIGGRYA